MATKLKTNGERAVLGDTRLPSRFWARVTEISTGCWIWERPMPDGYGRLRYGGKGSKFGLTRKHDAWRNTSRKEFGQDSLPQGA